jgi:O-antigen/teichoic acid export membrane protein
MVYVMIKKSFDKLLSSGNGYSLLANIVSSIFGLISFLIMVRVLPNDTFGLWVLFFTISSMVDLLRLGLTGTAAIKNISASSHNQNSVIAASYQLSLWATGFVLVLFYLIYFILSAVNPSNMYMPVLLFYPLLALTNLPFNQALVIAQGKINFRLVFILRFLGSGISFAFVIIYVLFIDKDLKGILISLILANLLTSSIISFFNKDGIKQLFTECKQERKDILRFGKYSTAGNIGSNLLRSSDTIILSLFAFMGTKAISVFAIPFKFVEVVEIPLRSFTATAFPRLSQALKPGYSKFNKILFGYIFWTTLLLFPFILTLFLFPGFFLKIVGGNNFADSIEIQKNILTVICIYIIFLPIDRFSGIALFALDKPELNFYKILFMLITNIVFDLMAVIFFKSLIFVALATLIFTILGIALGWFYLLREQKISWRDSMKYPLENIPL